MQQNIDKPEFWKISIEERTKHDNSFNQLNPTIVKSQKGNIQSRHD